MTSFHNQFFLQLTPCSYFTEKSAFNTADGCDIICKVLFLIWVLLLNWSTILPFVTSMYFKANGKFTVSTKNLKVRVFGSLYFLTFGVGEISGVRARGRYCYFSNRLLLLQSALKYFVNFLAST